MSLDEVDARPIQKGKSYPSTEFGTTLPVSFNREGFMITAESFIGQPGDKTLYPSTQELYREWMKKYPELGISDLGYRSQNNFKESKGYFYPDQRYIGFRFMKMVADGPIFSRIRRATTNMLTTAKWR